MAEVQGWGPSAWCVVKHLCRTFAGPDAELPRHRYGWRGRSESDIPRARHIPFARHAPVKAALTCSQYSNDITASVLASLEDRRLLVGGG